MAQTDNRRVVEFFFSPGSRYSYLAASQIPSIESQTGCRVDWRAVNGPDIRALRGRDPFAGEPVSGQYDWGYRRRDAEAWADYYGIPFREPPTHSFDFRLLARAATAAQRLGAAATYGWRLCSAIYGSSVWPVDESVCIRLANDSGLPVEQFIALLSDPRTDERLAATARDAYARGAFGVPTFFVGEQMFWGNDRIVILRHVLCKQRERQSSR
jgi:2-hydroxychromene-2-carboxylate isomerase